MAIQKQQEKRRLQQARARAKAKLKPRDVEPVAGRAHIEVQTELYLEELTDRVEETDQSVQTDPFLDRPPEPLFIPAKTGIDVETQIEAGDVSGDAGSLCSWPAYSLLPNAMSPLVSLYCAMGYTRADRCPLTW